MTDEPQPFAEVRGSYAMRKFGERKQPIMPQNVMDWRAEFETNIAPGLDRPRANPVAHGFTEMKERR